MTLPTGFQATLFAGEPDVVQPIAMAFDDRGRLWVVECLSYPGWKGTNDRVVILEDRDGDGRFDERTVFLDDGKNLSGINVGFGGVWLCSTPNLIFVPDADGNDKPDGPPQVMVDGFDIHASHNVSNSLTWGPDGWLYGCNGILSNSLIGTTGRGRGRAGENQLRRVAISSDAESRRSRGPRHDQSLGARFRRLWPDVHHQLRDCSSVARHSRCALPTDVRPGLQPAHLRFDRPLAPTICTGGAGIGPKPAAVPNIMRPAAATPIRAAWSIWATIGPTSYRNHVLTCNIHGHRLNQDVLERQGSGYVAHHGEDMMLVDDTWFRGLVVTYGPDGGVYVADWTDTGECHNYKVVDQTNGRIYKITAGKVRPWQGDLAKQSDQQLVALAIAPQRLVGAARPAIAAGATGGRQARRCRRVGGCWRCSPAMPTRRVSSARCGPCT